MSEHVTHCTVVNLATLCAHTWKSTPEGWCIFRFGAFHKNIRVSHLVLHLVLSGLKSIISHFFQLQVNFLLIEALRKYDTFMGPSFKVKFPTVDGEDLSLGEIADKIVSRITDIFMADSQGKRPCHGKWYLMNRNWLSDILCENYGIEK